ncbi:hypothetical protein HUT18_11925 [Streptomyces sp. NA04227]|uniref:hypothetical protein n=1 Tax=Streptomyces sp. NA04227 TaxID=2742136 RepID=UPI001591A69D|nr:hypothetical protein [Streptomyces sp. NA04227]QKW07006.1 hypothetical protein HUT18_11925 [Streptomyces sp. NA04227]
MHETFGPEYVRPAKKDCPNCHCCTEDLCCRGRNSLLKCVGLTPQDHKKTVYGCPCSAATTKHTAAWRAAQIRVTRLAREMPVDAAAEALLRALANGGEAQDDGTLTAQLRVRGLVQTINLLPAITELGRTYLAALDDERFTTPVEVLEVDKQARTASVVVVGWHLEKSVTVLMDQVTTDTGLDVAELSGRWLEAEANCHVSDVDRLVLTGFRDAPALPHGLMGGDAR